MNGDGPLGRRWGEMEKSRDIGGVVISPEDFANHMYLVGASGSGKTSLVRVLAKHLEMWNDNGTFSSAFIYVDPKGDDSYKFIQQCEPHTINEGRVHYLDPQETKFSINPLELPSYRPGEREDVVSRHVGYFMKTISEWYQQSSSYVQMERVFRALLFYLYSKHDAPTFTDLHDIVLRLQDGGEDALPQIMDALGAPDAYMVRALKGISVLKSDAFTPLLNRVEQFATDPMLRRMFAVRRGTVDFKEIIQPGRYTVIKISPLNTPHHIQPLAIQAIILKLWFAVQERASVVSEERTQVVLALDEFQVLGDLQVLHTMLEQARSLGLGLVLSHQTIEQINDRQLALITGNSGTQLAGKVHGRDASRMAQIWDPQFAKDLTQRLASQEYFRWMIREKAPPGEEQPFPVQFWLGMPPKLLVTKEQYGEFLSSQLARYGRGIVEDAIISQAAENKNKWLKSISVRFPTQMEWDIMRMLLEGPRQQVDMVARLAVPNRSEVLDALKDMMSRNLIIKTDPGNRMSAYEITPDARSAYFQPQFGEVGSAEDIDGMARVVFASYLKMGMFATVASQRVVKGRHRTDLVAYDYGKNIPISVEIESVSEVRSHPEHVRHNMTKWREMGFGQCHMWSRNPKIREIYDSLSDEERDGVQITVV